MNTSMRNTPYVRPALACLLAVTLATANARVLSAQQIVQPVLNVATTPNKQPFMMYMAQGSPTSYGVPYYYAFWYPVANYYVWNSTQMASSLVIEHIYITWSGPAGTALFVQMTSSYNSQLAGSTTGTYASAPMMFQTPAISASAPYVTASLPVTAYVPSVNSSSYGPQGRLSFTFSVNGSSWSSSVPSGAAVTVAGHFEPL